MICNIVILWLVSGDWCRTGVRCARLVSNVFLYTPEKGPKYKNSQVFCEKKLDKIYNSSWKDEKDGLLKDPNLPSVDHFISILTGRCIMQAIKWSATTSASFGRV